MKTFSEPLAAESDPNSNVTDFLERIASEDPDHELFSIQSDDTWTNLTAKQFHKEVKALAKGLIALGVKPGDKLGLLSRTRYEWTLLDFAMMYSGAISVPIYESSSPEQIKWVLGDSEAIGCFFELPEHLASFESISSSLKKVKHTWVIDNNDLESLKQAGSDVTDEELESRRSSANLDSLMTIIYTSGTTGNPKGCELLHRGFVELCNNGKAQLPYIINKESSTLLFLPLAHVLARFVSILCVSGGMKAGHLPDTKNVAAGLASFSPTFLLAVPRVFEKVYNGAQLKAETGGKGKIFDRAAETAIQFSEALATKSGPSLGLKLKHKLFDRLVFGKLREAMGGRVKYAISGGAPLGARLGHFYRGIGLTVLEGYGLTETYAPATLGRGEKIKIGKVGYPLPGTSVAIADDGEVLLKGYNIFRGYWKNEKATREALVDGWFHTGDIGELDDDGFLSITGRKKELLVTAGGKNVAPAALEDPLRAHPLIGQVVVIGDQKPFISALISLDPEMLPVWAKGHGIESADTIHDAISNTKIRDTIQQKIDQVNKRFSSAEQIKKFAFIASELTEASGHMTPSLKVKRERVLADFEEQVTEIYG
jgi:long-chain acyl-CoA synthetase